MKTIKTYITADGLDLYAAFFSKLRDPIAKAKIASRVNRMASDNVGDHKPCRDGVWERRIAQGAGVSRESLYRTLSPAGNPTLKTLRSVVKAAGFQFSALASA